jgi:hypothetical protein
VVKLVTEGGPEACRVAPWGTTDAAGDGRAGGR